MIRFNNQYVWNFVFTLFFLCLIGLAVVVLEEVGYRSYESLTVFDVVLMTLATWRVVRLFVYDAITKWFREQFYNLVHENGEVRLIKPATGPRCTLCDLFSCPWCFGAWAGATVAFFYLLTPYAFFPVLVLAISAVATWLQLTSNLIGHSAERLKRQNERDF